MKSQELKEKVNAKIIEKGFDKGECHFWETGTIIEGIVKDILKEIPNTEFLVRSGYKYEDENKNNLYVYTNTHSYIDEQNNHLLCEIKINRTKVRTKYYSKSYHYSLWAITGVTIKSLKDVEFEDEYKLAKTEKEQADKERAEREAKAQAEYEERQRQREIDGTNKAQKVLDYIKEHNLNIEEFEDMANKYYNYSNYVSKILNK